MITLIHGDNIQQSRDFYLQLKQKYQSIKTLEGDKLVYTDVVEATQGDGLFSLTDAIFIEQLISKKRAGAELDSIVDYLNSKPESVIILWEGKEIDKKMIGKFKNATIRLFSYPRTLFQFIDAFYPGNGKKLIILYHQTLQTEAAELILFMLTKQVRIMLTLLNSLGEEIDEVKRVQPWQKTKVQKQAKQFSIEQLKKIHDKLYEFDYGYKTGNLSLPLASSLDFFLSAI